MPHLQISGVQTLDNTDFFFYYLPFPIEINCSTSHVVDLTENMVVSPLHSKIAGRAEREKELTHPSPRSQKSEVKSAKTDKETSKVTTAFLPNKVTRVGRVLATEVTELK